MQQYYPERSAFVKFIYCWKKWYYQKKYNFAHLEFFCYHLGEKMNEEIVTFYPRKLQAELYSKVNNERLWAITKDKFASYLILKDFYKRECVGYNPAPSVFVQPFYENHDCKTEVITFLERHSSFIIKPLADACGHGIRIVSNCIIDSEVMFKRLMTEFPRGFVLEELISQREELGIFHPSSVNTIRMNVFNSSSYPGGSIDLRFPCFRVGRHNAVVDNAGSGGIIVALDSSSGQMVSAADEDGLFYQEHPETHIPFNGVIPNWDDLLLSAKSVSMTIPELKVAGLDFALDKEKGWSLIEINVEPIQLYQIAMQKGIRKYMTDFAKICGV